MPTRAARPALRALISVMGLIGFGCVQPDRIAAPPTSAQFTISDGRSGGTKGFYFLPPLVPPPQATGTFDATLEPELSVCELTVTTCGPELARFTASTSPAVTLDLAGEAYALLWQIKGGPLVAGHVYRVTVVVGAFTLGYADLAVVASPGELKSVPAGFIGVLVDHTINVRFRIETGIVASIALSPSSALLGIGATKTFTVQGVDLHGAPVTISDPISWSASAANITVSSAGVVTAVSAGAANVTAQVDGLQATAAVEVIHQLLFGVSNQAAASTDLMLFRAGASLSYLTSIPEPLVRNFAWRPDGARIAYSAGLPDEIFIMNADGTGVTQITPSDDGRAAAGPSWSPDGTKIAFESMVNPSDYLQYGEIWIMDADGGNAHAILASAGHHLVLPVWSPDGAHIAFEDAWDLLVMNPDGSGVTELASLPFLNEAVSWSPDSKKIVFDACPDSPVACVLYTVDVSSKLVTPLAAPTGASTFRTPVWSPDGGRIAFVRIEGGPVYTMAVKMIRPDGSDLVSLWQTVLSNPFLPIAWRP